MLQSHCPNYLSDTVLDLPVAQREWLSVDHALRFDDPDSPACILYIQGWAYSSTWGNDTARRAVIVTLPDGQRWRVPADQQRDDVADQIAGVPRYCGFNGYLHIDDRQRLAQGLTIAADAVGGASERLHGVSVAAELPDRASFRQLPASRRRKLDNLLRNEVERLFQKSALRSKPLYLQLDPSFQCQLNCPSCHGDMAREAGVRKPILDLAKAERILAEFGPTLIQAHLFNWGEPLLNRQFHQLVAMAKRHDIWTSTSTNLSLPLSQQRVDAIIEAGLDYMIVGVDGITQETYETYRKGGDLELVLRNLRLFVERKRALGRTTPHLLFQYLDFPWNRHEIDRARAVAEEIGVDEFHVKTGCDHGREPVPAAPGAPSLTLTDAALLQHLTAHRDRKRSEQRYFGCDHLYQQLTINSDGSVHPCCYVVAPEHEIAHVDSDTDVFNSPALRSARSRMADLDDGKLLSHSPCANCWIVGDHEARGHKTTAINFISGLELLLGHGFVDDQLPRAARPAPPPRSFSWRRLLPF